MRTLLHWGMPLALLLVLAVPAQKAQGFNWMICPGGGECKWSEMPQAAQWDTSTMTTAMSWIAGDACFDWEDAAPTSYDISTFSGVSATGPSLDLHNRVYFHNITAQCGNCTGWTLNWVFGSGSNTVLDSDVEVNSDPVRTWYVGTGTCPSDKYDFWTVVLHEYGHMALCAHSGVTGAIMKPGVGKGQMRRSFHTDDINCLMYGELIGAY